MSWVLAGICSHFVGFKLRPLSSSPLWKPTKKASEAALLSVIEKETVKSRGLPAVSDCAQPSQMAPSRPRAKNSGRLVAPSCARDPLWAKQDNKATTFHSRSTSYSSWPSQGLPVGFPEEHWKAFSSSLSSFWSHRRGQWLHNRFQVRNSEVSGHVFKHRSQQTFFCKLSESVSCAHRASGIHPSFSRLPGKHS